MKARLVNEVQEFKRTGDSKKSLGVGTYRKIEEGDKFRILKNLYWHPGTPGKEIGQWHEKTMGRLSDEMQMVKNDIVTVFDFRDFNEDNNDEHNRQWVGTISANNGKDRYFKIDWVKKYMNKYLERI